MVNTLLKCFGKRAGDCEDAAALYISLSGRELTIYLMRLKKAKHN